MIDGSRNINWYKVPREQITMGQWNKLIDKLREVGAKEIKPGFGKTVTSYKRLRDSYFVNTFGNYFELYTFHPALGLHHYYVTLDKNTTSVERKPEEDIINGTAALKMVYKDFKRLYGIEMRSAFGSTDKTKTICREIKDCVPGYLNYIIPSGCFRDKILNGVKKGDISSAFTAMACKSLPTLKGAIKLPGRIDPSEDLPFAFYTKSRHMAIYNELDTRRYHKTVYKGNLELFEEKQRYFNVADQDEVTILCPVSEYSLKDIYQHYYYLKEYSDNHMDRIAAKSILNKSIGAMQARKCPYLSFISAVAIARHNDRIISLAEQIEKNGDLVLAIMTDSVCWVGDRSEGVFEERQLGAFCREYDDAKMILCEPKKYQIMNKDGSKLKTAWAGRHATAPYRFGDVLDLQDVGVKFNFTENKFLNEVKIDGSL